MTPPDGTVTWPGKTIPPWTCTTIEVELAIRQHEYIAEETDLRLKHLVVDEDFAMVDAGRMDDPLDSIPEGKGDTMVVSNVHYLEVSILS